MKLCFDGLTGILYESVMEICSMLSIDIGKDGTRVKTQKRESGITITKSLNGIVLEYGSVCQLMRGIALLAEYETKTEGFQYRETPRLEGLSVMVDCSRNAVMNLEAYKHFVRRLSVMGYTEIQLYTEDTFELAEYPYFGYMRGRYTGAELREMDNYADRFGISLIPCVQTLAHLENIFKWAEFSDVHDVGGILLVGQEKTYELIDAIFRTMSENVKSRKINIGMDEAHMIGLGKYLEQNGFQNRFDIILKHITRVLEIAGKYGYRPMMWSDMFFRLLANGDYYADNIEIPREILEKIPENISLVYWDYYSEDSETYNRMLRIHKGFGREIVFAGGAWKWHGFTPGNEYSLKIGRLASRAVLRNGIKNVLVTSWGDNGAEGSIFAMLPTLQYWAEVCYSENADTALPGRFSVSAGISFSDFISLDEPLFSADNPAPGLCGLNLPKVLLYQDVLLGLLENDYQHDKIAEHYRQCAQRLMAIADKGGPWAFLFETQAALCNVLELKADIGARLREAYHNGDKELLKIYTNNQLPEIVKRLEKFQTLYRAQWSRENKYTGLDTFDLRTGGLKERIYVAAARLQSYLDGKITSIPEFEEKTLPFTYNRKGNGAHRLSMLRWHTVATPSIIS